MVIDGEYHLTGVITNGDILRWMTRQNEPNLKIAVTEIQNTDFLFTTNHSSKSEIKALLRKVQYLPVINDQNQLISIYSNQPQSLLEIGKSLIGENQPTYVIAEIGINHNGSHEIANALMEKAAECGADAVKVQLRDLNSIYTESVLKNSHKHSTQYLLNELRNCI